MIATDNIAIVSFDTAKLAFRAGFNESYQQEGYDENGVYKLCTYSTYCANEDHVETKLYAAPSLALLQKWMIEVHNLYIRVDFILNKNMWSYSYLDLEKCTSGKNYLCYLRDTSQQFSIIKSKNMIFNNYEDALEAGLVKGLNILLKCTTHSETQP